MRVGLKVVPRGAIKLTGQQIAAELVADLKRLTARLDEVIAALAAESNTTDAA